VNAQSPSRFSIAPRASGALGVREYLPTGTEPGRPYARSSPRPQTMHARPICGAGMTGGGSLDLGVLGDPLQLVPLHDQVDVVAARAVTAQPRCPAADYHRLGHRSRQLLQAPFGARSSGDEVALIAADHRPRIDLFDEAGGLPAGQRERVGVGMGKRNGLQAAARQPRVGLEHQQLD
jgi:hypothetical protein